MSRTQYDIRNTQYGIFNTQYAIRDTQYGICNTRYAIRYTHHAIRNRPLHLSRELYKSTLFMQNKAKFSRAGRISTPSAGRSFSGRYFISTGRCKKDLVRMLKCCTALPRTSTNRNIPSSFAGLKAFITYLSFTEDERITTLRPLSRARRNCCCSISEI